MTANPAQGLRATRCGPIRLTPAGRVAMPLTIGKDTAHLGDTDLVMTYDDAAALHAEIGRLLNLQTTDDRATS